MEGGRLQREINEQRTITDMGIPRTDSGISCDRARHAVAPSELRPLLRWGTIVIALNRRLTWVVYPASNWCFRP